MIGNSSIIILSFAGVMVVFSFIGISEFLLSGGADGYIDNNFLSVFGWALIGSIGIGMIGLMTTDISVPVPAAFVGFLLAVSWYFVTDML